MTRNALQLALREMQAATTNRFSRVGMILTTVVLAVSGPFGTFQSFSLGQRFGYWAITVLCCYLTGQGAATYFIELLRDQITQRWPRVIVAGLLASLPVTIMVLVINGIAYQHMDVTESLTIWLYATIITLAIVVLFVTLSDLMHPAVAQEAATPSPGAEPVPVVSTTVIAAPPAILERVALPQRGRLIALIVEDHYVDIVTDKGKTLVLMRLADAIREAAPVPGLQVHRSHWVALDAVVRTQRSDGKVVLVLSYGMMLPVSRGYLQTTKEAGLVV